MGPLGGLPLPNGWTTSITEAVDQLQPNVQPQHNQKLGKSISSSCELISIGLVHHVMCLFSIYFQLLQVVVVLHSGSTLVSINKVNLRRVRLIVGWVTMSLSGFNSRCRTFILVCDQPPRPTQSFILQGSVNEDPLRLARKRQIWFIPLANKPEVCS